MNWFYRENFRPAAKKGITAALRWWWIRLFNPLTENKGAAAALAISICSLYFSWQELNALRQELHQSKTQWRTSLLLELGNAKAEHYRDELQQIILEIDSVDANTPLPAQLQNRVKDFCNDRIEAYFVVQQGDLNENLSSPERGILFRVLQRSGHLKELLNELDFGYADLAGYDLSPGEDLKDGWFKHSSFASAHLDEVRLDSAYLINANFSKAFLNGASLANADVSDATFRGADLRNTDFRGAINTIKADFSGANLAGAIVDSDFPISSMWQIVQDDEGNRLELRETTP